MVIKHISPSKYVNNMKASELIIELASTIASVGDLEVGVCRESGGEPIHEVTAADKFADNDNFIQILYER